MKAKPLVIGALILAAVPAALAISGEVPRWTSGGSAIVAGDPIAPLGNFPIVVSGGASVAFEGDSNMAGLTVSGHTHAFPAIFAEHTGNRVTVRNHAVGGKTILTREPQPAGIEPAALVVIMFGSNDAAPRGFLSRKKKVPLKVYSDRMIATIGQFQNQGSRVLVLAAPPVGSRAMARRIEPYRQAARSAAIATGAHFRDPLEALQVSTSSPILLADGLHLTPVSQQLMGEWLAQWINTVEPGQMRDQSDNHE